MFKVVADVRRNRLYITLTGHFEREETKSIVEAINQQAVKLARGFDLINDISAAHPTDEFGLKELIQMQELLVSLGVRRVIRVTKILLTELQLDRASKHDGYRWVNVPTLDQAEKMLDSCVVPEDPHQRRNWEQLRKYRRVSVGPDHAVQFSLGPLELTNVRITNLSAEGCFALVREDYGKFFREGIHLTNFRLEHADLPSMRITAKVVRVVPGLSEVTEKDLGLGVQFLSTSQQFTEWVDAYVMAYYGLNH